MPQCCLEQETLESKMAETDEDLRQQRAEVEAVRWVACCSVPGPCGKVFLLLLSLCPWVFCVM